MSRFQMTQVGQCLPGMAGPKTFAAWPVWSGSVRDKVRFRPVERDTRRRWYEGLCELEDQTKQPGHENGKVSEIGLRVAQALAFKFLNTATGRLDPSYAEIAKAARLCIRSVANALRRLSEIGALTWFRRCREGRGDDGQYRLEQESNAYAILPPSQWKGYTPKPEAPPPDSESWGVANVIEQQPFGVDPEYDLIVVKAEGGPLEGVYTRHLRQRIEDAKKARHLLECTGCQETIFHQESKMESP